MPAIKLPVGAFQTLLMKNTIKSRRDTSFDIKLIACPETPSFIECFESCDIFDMRKRIVSNSDDIIKFVLTYFSAYE